MFVMSCSINFLAPALLPRPHALPHAAREKIIGWYSTGPKLKEADLDINDLIGNFCEKPVLVICEVQVRPPTRLTKAQRAVSAYVMAPALGAEGAAACPFVQLMPRNPVTD